MINPYSLLRKIHSYASLYALLGRDPARKTATMLRRLRSDSNSSVRRFYRDLGPLTRPGYDSLTYLNSAYSGFEGMLKHLLNTLMVDNSGIPQWNRLCAAVTASEESAREYIGGVLTINPDSVLARVMVAMNFIDYYRKASDKSDRNRLVASFMRSRLRMSGSNTQELEQLSEAFLRSAVGIMVISFIEENEGGKGLNMGGFALLLNLAALSPVSLLPSIQHRRVKELISQVVAYRNKVDHGAFFHEELEESLEKNSKSEKATSIRQRRISRHNEAIATLLTLLILLLGSDSDHAPGFVQLALSKVGDSLSYYPRKLFFAFLSKVTNAAVGLVVALSRIAVVLGAIALFFIGMWIWTDEGINFKPISDPKMKLAMIDALIDSDTLRIIELKNQYRINQQNDYLKDMRQACPDPKKTKWDASSTTIKVGGIEGYKIYPNVPIMYAPGHDDLDQYAKTQLYTLFSALNQAGSRINNLTIGIIIPYSTADLDRNPDVEQSRYNALVNYLKTLTKAEITYKLIQTGTGYSDVNLYFIEQ